MLHFQFCHPFKLFQNLELHRMHFINIELSYYQPKIPYFLEKSEINITHSSSPFRYQDFIFEVWLARFTSIVDLEVVIVDSRSPILFSRLSIIQI